MREQRNLIPVENSGKGDCLFMALSSAYWNNYLLHERMRNIIVTYMKYFTERYNRDHHYCEKMSQSGSQGSYSELQVISDLTLTQIEIYSTKDYYVPISTIFPHYPAV